VAPPPPALTTLLVQARRALRAAQAARLAGRDLGPREAAALVGLARKPASTPGELAVELALDAPATSRLLAGLHRQKLVELRPDRLDRRRTRLLLTDAGRDAAAELAAVAEALEEEAVKGLTPEALAAMRGALGHILANLRGALAPPAKAGTRAPPHGRPRSRSR